MSRSVITTGGLHSSLCQAMTWHDFTRQGHEPPGFRHKKSSIDRILALRALIERLRDFRSGLSAAYVDLDKAFDSVNRDVLWRILALRGIPPKLVNMIYVLDYDTECWEV